MIPVNRTLKELELLHDVEQFLDIVEDNLEDSVYKGELVVADSYKNEEDMKRLILSFRNYLNKLKTHGGYPELDKDEWVIAIKHSRDDTLYHEYAIHLSENYSTNDVIKLFSDMYDANFEYIGKFIKKD